MTRWRKPRGPDRRAHVVRAVVAALVAALASCAAPEASTEIRATQLASCGDVLGPERSAQLEKALLPGSDEPPWISSAVGDLLDCKMVLPGSLLTAVGARGHGDASLALTPLLGAVLTGNADLVRTLARAGASVEVLAGDGTPAVHFAAASGHLAVLRALLAGGAGVEARGPNGRSALAVAIAAAQEATAVALLEHGADHRVLDRGLPLILSAAIAAKAGIVAELLDRGAEAQAVYKVASNALAERGLDIELGQEVHVTALHLAAYRGSFDSVRLLVERGARVDEPNDVGVTSMQAAVWGNHPDIARYLLEQGAAVDHRADDGRTALFIAVDEGHLAVAQVLLGAGADPTIADESGTSPMDAALAKGNGDMLALLRGRGVPWDERDRSLPTGWIDSEGFDPRAATTASDDTLPVDVDVGGGWIVWAESGTGRIRRIPEKGGPIEVVHQDPVGHPMGVAVAAGQLLWTSDGVYPRRVQRLEVASMRYEALAIGPLVNRPRAIAADGEAVFWTEAINGRIRTIDEKDGLIVDIVTDAIEASTERSGFRPMYALGLALDAEKRRVYWSDAVAASIERVGYDTSGREVVMRAREGLDMPVGLALDPRAQALYAADASRARLLRMDLRSGAITTIADPTNGLVEPRGIAINPTGTWIYWADRARGEIGRVPVAGGAVETLRLDEPAAASFEPRPRPTDCSSASRAAGQRVGLEVAKRAAICLEKVDAIKAVQRSFRDVRQIVPSCRRLLAPLADEDRLRRSLAELEVAVDLCGDRLGMSSFRDGCDDAPAGCESTACLVSDCRRWTWRQVVGRMPNAEEWLGELRPFLAAEAATGTSAVRRDASLSVAMIDEILTAVRRDVHPTSHFDELPSTGMRLSYRAVRGTSESLIAVPDDAALRRGVPRRFVDHRDGTVTDSVTGLMWEKKCDGCGSAHGVRTLLAWSPSQPGNVWAWLAEINREGGTGFGGYSDWRLPTIKELQTLVDYERFNPAVPVEFDGAACGLGCIDLSDTNCSCTLMDAYWSSTELHAAPQRAFGLKFNLGLVAHQPKQARAAVRAVRDAALQSYPARGQEELDGAATKLSSSQGSS